MDRKVISDWIIKNYQFIAVVAMFATAMLGYPIRVEKAPPGTDPGVIILLPEGPSGEGVAKTLGSQPASTAWSANERLSLRVAIAVLERKPDESASPLLAHLRRLLSDRGQLRERSTWNN
jgi:hypothetical protein